MMDILALLQWFNPTHLNTTNLRRAWLVFQPCFEPSLREKGAHHPSPLAKRGQREVSLFPLSAHTPAL